MLLIGSWRDVVAPATREKGIGDGDHHDHAVNDNDYDGDDDYCEDDDINNDDIDIIKMIMISPLSSIYQGVVSHIMASPHPPD